jgi:hypothetical protein
MDSGFRRDDDRGARWCSCGALDERYFQIGFPLPGSPSPGHFRVTVSTTA